MTAQGLQTFEGCYCPFCNEPGRKLERNISQAGLAVAVCVMEESYSIQLRDHGIKFDGINCAINTCDRCYNRARKAISWAQTAFPGNIFFEAAGKHKAAVVAAAAIKLSTQLFCGPDAYGLPKTMVLNIKLFLIIFSICFFKY